MTVKFTDSNGNDLDDVFELAPSEWYSIYNKAVGQDFDVNSRVTAVPAGQYLTDASGQVDLLKRYLWKGYGTQATGGTGYAIGITVRSKDAQGNPTGSSREESIEFKYYAAANGSSGGAPNFSSSSQSQSSSFVFPVVQGNTVRNTTRGFSKSRPATTGSFPITSYSIVGTSTLVRNSGSFMTASFSGGQPTVSSTGVVSFNLYFNTAQNTYGTATFTVVVKTKATNAMGDSNTATTTFSISAERDFGGGGGGGPGL